MNHPIQRVSKKGEIQYLTGEEINELLKVKYEDKEHYPKFQPIVWSESKQRFFNKLDQLLMVRRGLSVTDRELIEHITKSIGYDLKISPVRKLIRLKKTKGRW